MPKFEFRLQKVLEYRELEESWARDALLAARTAREEREIEIAQVGSRRASLLERPTMSLDDRRNLELLMQKMDDEERDHQTVLGVLQNEEQTAIREWQSRKQAVEALVRLREAALDTWRLEEERREQAELDEWTTMRRAA